jgi:hypothetical protein
LLFVHENADERIEGLPSRNALGTAAEGRVEHLVAIAKARRMAIPRAND